MIGGQGGTTPTYLAYDGSKLLTERDENAFTYGRYRHGSYIGVDDQESGTVMTPSVDERGSVLYLADAPSAGSAVYTAFGWEVTNTLATTTRLMFMPSLFEKLNLSNVRLSMTATGLYWPLFGVGLVGPGFLGRLGWWQGGEEGQSAPSPRSDDDDGDDARDTPPPVIYGEEIDADCSNPTDGGTLRAQLTPKHTAGKIEIDLWYYPSNSVRECCETVKFVQIEKLKVIGRDGLRDARGNDWQMDYGPGRPDVPFYFGLSSPSRRCSPERRQRPGAFSTREK